jgi:hypothetical protein
VDQDSLTPGARVARRRGDNLRRTLVAPLLAALLAAAATALAASQGAFAAGGQSTVVVNPGTTTIIAGYGYSCQDTIRTPNWSCQYGPPSGPAKTPITTVSKGSRTMTVESLLRPTVVLQNGDYVTTIKR